MAFDINVSLSTLLSTSSAIHELPAYDSLIFNGAGDYFIIDNVANTSLGIYKTKKLSYEGLGDSIYYRWLTQVSLYIPITAGYTGSFAAIAQNSIVGTLSTVQIRTTTTENRTAALQYGEFSLSGNSYMAYSTTSKKVGIGTQTPNEKLTVSGIISSNNSAFVSNLDINGTSIADGTMNLRGPTPNGRVQFNHFGNGGLKITTNNSSNTRLQISDDINGYVGIGSATLTQLFNVGTHFKVNATGYVGVKTTPSATDSLTVSGNSVFIGDVTTTGQFIGSGTIPIGGIIMWSGVSIPSGWSLCDGSGGTPDLRNRFIVGSGLSYSTGSTNALTLSSVTLNATQIPAHSHTSNPHTHQYTIFSDAAGDGNGWVNDEAGDTVTQTTASTTVTINANTGGGQSHENRPPYYALAYIMRTV